MVIGSLQLCGHDGCFIAFFSLRNSWIGGPNSPLLLFGSYWFFFLLCHSFTQWSKAWFCKEDPAKNLSKPIILEAGALPQYISYLLATLIIWLLLQCYVQIIKGIGIWHEGKIVYVGWTMPTDHCGIYFYRFRVVQGAYECVLLCVGKFFHHLHLEVFPACIPAISPFGQCRLLRNCPEEHWQWHCDKICFWVHSWCVFQQVFLHLTV